MILFLFSPKKVGLYLEFIICSHLADSPVSDKKPISWATDLCGNK